MPRTTAQWTISLPPALSREAERFARLESRTRSELVREALRAYMEHRQKLLEIRLKLARNLDKRGIRTLEDVEKLVDEGRR